MTPRQQELREQGLKLRAQIASQRADLGRVCAPLNGLTEAGGQGLALGNNLLSYLKAHPLPVVALAAVLLVFKPRPSLRWARRGLVLWRGWKLLRHRLPALLQLLQGLRTSAQRSTS